MMAGGLGHPGPLYACREGLRVVYIGHLVEGEDGEEAEVIEAVACRRCCEA